MSDNPWIEHDGGPMPVGDDELIDVRLKDGRTSRRHRAGDIAAWRWEWLIAHLWRGDIIAYRLSGPSA